MTKRKAETKRSQAADKKRMDAKATKVVKNGNAKHAKHRRALKARATTHALVWRDVTCKVRHTPNYLQQGWSHIELIVTAPKDAPLPITTTGYLSHFLDTEQLADAGGPAAFFLAWIEREAKTRQWAKREFAWRQLELFPR